MLAAHSVYGPDGMLVGVCPTRRLAAKVAHNLTQLGDDVFFIKEALPEEIRDMLAEPSPQLYVTCTTLPPRRGTAIGPPEVADLCITSRYEGHHCE